MVTQQRIPIEERIIRLLQHLGIEKAHFAGSVPSDLVGLATTSPEYISSLSLICPLRRFDWSSLRTVSSRLLVFTGDQGPPAEAVRQATAGLPDAAVVTLHDYSSSPTGDAIADRTREIGSAFREFLGRMEQRNGSRLGPLPESEGEVAGITYRIRGSGPPVVLLPLDWTASQWELLVPTLSERYCTITLGGAEIGVIARIEERGRSAGFLRVVGNMMDEVGLQPGETVLDVGCGSGVLVRRLAHRTSGANPILATDVNPYLLREAADLARREGLEGALEFQEANAEALPFIDQRFDVSTCVTVFGFGDASKMLAEMVRVTKPGGRVAVIERSTDIPFWANVPLRSDLKARIEATAPTLVARTIAERGCADASLYRRFRQVGLSQIKMLPQMAVYDEESRGQALQLSDQNILPALSSDEAAEWRAAVALAEEDGTLFIAQPFHVAVGTKPS